jgi:spoIIIJ-associated protein
MDKTEIQKLIKELIEKLNISVSEVSILENEPNTIWLKADVAEPHLFTSREGEALMALNHLAHRIIETKTSKDVAMPQFLIDVNDFQKKKVDAIRAVAHMMAERARYFKANVNIDPMSAFERRIVHEFLSNETDLKTESAGFGPTRHVVIQYLGAI